MSFNASIPLTDLRYIGTDFSSLSWLERNWAAWYIYFENPVVATALLNFLIHETVYFGRAIPWMIIDSLPYFRKWKLQPGKVPSPEEQWQCIKSLLLSHFTVQLPLIWMFHPVAEGFGLATYQVPFPTLKEMIFPLVFFFVFEDFFHFVAHQALHYGPLYRNIHKMHHKYSAPFGLVAEYAHPAEVFILGLGTIGGPLLYVLVTGDLHMVVVILWIVLRLFQTIDAHSGYDFPWSLRHFVPFWSGAEHHDFHHMAFTNNYSTSFRWWDIIFGTDDKYREYRNRVKAATSLLKNPTHEQQHQIENELLKEVEAEGIRAEAEAEGSAPKTIKIQ